ncbi:putative autotransporter adhesin-like protein [Litorimonas taeanensis]|uniref:Putative autotransporter adhesin-like protein n=1 Tax=Litorimonas taeanensis TaxID=568099 RepID=A0A420WI91_9PROT|nr:head GIN domain-containing protein [Litorimonas taeanensis]RKQ70744.1 putative autotransporter adhesin-like protein [Litorimonas taeanensis]
MFKLTQLKSISAISILTISGLIASQAQAHPEHDEGKNKTAEVEKTFNYSGFDEIEIAGVFNMDVQIGKAFSIHTAGDKKEMERLKVTLKNDVLILDMSEGNKRKRWGKNNHGIDVTITMPSLNGLEIAGIGSGNIYGIDSDAFSLDVSGIGGIQLDGSCRTLDVDFDGMGDVDAKNLKCETVDIDVSGMGAASVYASESVDADMSGMGSIDVYGNPKKVKKDKGFMSSINIH